tara:strand:+ start:459 stop:665 length:207 start_codon:yes stop_codon:yes gene_type:complete
MSSQDMPIRENTDGTLYTEEEYLIMFSKENQPKKRGRPFGSKNTGMSKKSSGDYHLKISHKEFILSFD